MRHGRLLRTRVVLGFGLGFLVLYLLFWPAPIDPVAWTPPASPPLTGPYSVNTDLVSLERLTIGSHRGPEDVAIDSLGRIYVGEEDGAILRMSARGAGDRPDGVVEEFARVDGRPLGLEFDPGGNLLVAAAGRGLVSISRTGMVTILVEEYAGAPVRFVNDVAAGPDGTVYFSESSTKFGIDDTTLGLLEHRPYGRLFAYDPETGETRLLLGGLHYANGVAVDPRGSFVLVAETGKYRVQRVWISGPRAGQSEILIENLPGFPDGISTGDAGVFWLALVSPRLESVDNRLLPHPVLREVIARLPAFLLPKARNYGFVLGLDAQGTVVRNLQDPSGSFAQMSSVEEHDGQLYLGSLVERSVGRLPVPDG
jgi:sugar lactone lactonase YvrE